MSYIFAPGATSKSIHVQIVNDTGLPVTGLDNTTFPATYYQLAGANAGVQITLASLAAITTAWASGGVKEIDGTNQKGYYRLDLPNAALATAGHVKITGEATNKRLIAEAIFVDQRVPDAPPGTLDGIITLKSIGAIDGAIVSDAGNTSSAFLTNLAETRVNYYGNATKGGVIVFVTGVNAKQDRRISAYDGAGKITVSEAFAIVPDPADKFIIIGRIE